MKGQCYINVIMNKFDYQHISHVERRRLQFHEEKFVFECQTESVIVISFADVYTRKSLNYLSIHPSCSPIPYPILVPVQNPPSFSAVLSRCKRIPEVVFLITFLRAARESSQRCAIILRASQID